MLNVLHFEAEYKREVNDHGPSAEIHKQIESRNRKDEHTLISGNTLAHKMLICGVKKNEMKR